MSVGIHNNNNLYDVGTERKIDMLFRILFTSIY